MTKATVKGVRLKISEREPLCAGTADTYKLELSFSEEWAGLLKQIDFTNKSSGETRRISAQMQTVTVPWEVLKVEGDVSCRIRGVGADGKLKLRTNEANLGTVLGIWQDDAPGSVSPTPDVCDELARKIGELSELETDEKSSLTAALNEVRQTADSKQDKLIAGDNITIAADGKTISATGGAGGGLGFFEVALTKQTDGSYTADKSFAQVKAELESGKRVMLLDGYDYIFFLASLSENRAEFMAFVDGDAGWLLATALSGGAWSLKAVPRVTEAVFNELSASLGALASLKTTDKSSVVAAINELKDASPSQGGEQWELIRYIEIPEGAEESNALTIDKDGSDQAFSLKKAKLFYSYPAYTGSSTIPGYLFSMLNGYSGGANKTYTYTSAFLVPHKTLERAGSWEVDVATFPGIQCETVEGYNNTTSALRGGSGPTRHSPITSIGATGALIYPGCKFWLYGVRA